MPQPLKTFIIYARADASYKNALLKHLHPFVEHGLLEKWDDSDLLAGEDWEKRIEKELDAAQLVLLLVSPDALQSEFIRKKELKAALEKKQSGSARVVPILVRDCFWKLHPEISKMQILPLDESGKIKGVSGWRSEDSAWYNCCEELYKLILEIGAILDKEVKIQAQQNALQAQLQAAEAEKNEKDRSLRDNAFWKRIQNELAHTDDPAQKLALLDTYLKDEEHRNHRDAAEKTEAELKADIAAAEKIEVVRKKREEDAEKARKAAEEKKKREEELAKAKKEEERKKRETEKKKTEEEQKRRENAWEPEMVFVKGGTFTMGSPAGEEGRYSDEVQHPVTLSDFYIAKYPVTQKLWKTAMGDNPSHFKGDNLPVENVSWDDCRNFIQKLNQKTGKNYRLPTEAEWEYAARGGDLSKGFVYAGSNNPDEVAWHSGNSGTKTHPVGQKKANELGLFDMSGNVWEWCGDWYGSYPTGAQNNPAGPKSGSYRVNRGGSWFNTARGCRVARRLNGYTPVYRNSDLGFRLASPSQ